jgi:hypothetical protein
MTKTLQDLILGPEFQAGVAAAVAEAVRQADAAGLPKAYETDFSQRREDPQANPGTRK